MGRRGKGDEDGRGGRGEGGSKEETFLLNSLKSVQEDTLYGHFLGKKFGKKKKRKRVV
jgi:hypothetical protein